MYYIASTNNPIFQKREYTLSYLVWYTKYKQIFVKYPGIIANHTEIVSKHLLDIKSRLLYLKKKEDESVSLTTNHLTKLFTTSGDTFFHYFTSSDT